MPFKPRGRFFIKLAFPGGGSFSVESDPKRSLTVHEVVDQLRHYAEFIDEHFQRPESATKRAAVDPAGPDAVADPRPRATES